MIAQTLVLLVLSILLSVATYAVAKPISKSTPSDSHSEKLEKDAL